MILSIDIGGTNTRLAIFDEKSKIVKTNKFKTIAKSPEENFDKIITFINQNEGIDAIGISAPGPTDYENGIIGNLPNLPLWENFAFIKYLKNKTMISNIKSGNDANLMALAYHFHFNGTFKDITQFLQFSTGLGAGLIINNKIFTGFNGLGQEIAHLPTAWKKQAGKNLGEGSVEFFSSGSGLLIRAQAITSKQIEPNDIMVKPIFKEVVAEGIEALANLIACSAGLINPSKVIFDGAVARHHPWYVEKAIELAKNRMFDKQFATIDFKFGDLGDDAALYGAFHLVSRNI